MRAAAFFDLDKTLIEGSSGYYFARAGYRAGMISRRQLASDLWSNVRFRLQGLSDHAAEALYQRVLRDLAGVPVRDLARLTHDVLAGILPRLYPEMLEVAWRHQDAGRRAYIVTAASQEIAELLAQILALDGGIGARYEATEGIYTGRPGGVFTYGAGKVEAMDELAAAEGIDLGESYAYSDSASDLPMLRAVGHPVVVNPDAELERVARAEGWQVMRFDKLARRLRLAAAAGGFALLAAGGGYVAGELRTRGVRLLPARP
jgi:HAD superfamily hydrolase (TIGR01490 family)